MRASAYKLVAVLLATGVITSLAAESVLPLLVFTTVSYSVWHVAKALDEL